MSAPRGASVLALPSAPLVSRLLADRRVVAAVRRAPLVLGLLAVLAGAATLYHLSYPSTLGTRERVLGATDLVGPVTVASVLVLLAYVASWRSLGRLHRRLLAHLPGVLVEEPPEVTVTAYAHGVVSGLAAVRALRTPVADAYVEAFASSASAGSSVADPSRTAVLLVLDDGLHSLLDDALGGSDDGLVEDVLRASYELRDHPAEHAAVLGAPRTWVDLRRRRGVVRAVLSDLDSGVPLEWAVRRLSGGVAS